MYTCTAFNGAVLIMRNNVTRKIIALRFFILAGIGASLYYLVSVHHISLWYVLAGGALTGVLFGKVFCRWMCPMSIIMELIMNLSGDKNAAMLQYHKLGCPIAWVSGWLNRYSIFSISRNKNTCTSCGLCDKSCYISTLEPDTYSLYKKSKENAGNSYTCSRCLKCVAACPNSSLSYSLRKKEQQKQSIAKSED